MSQKVVVWDPHVYVSLQKRMAFEGREVLSLFSPFLKELLPQEKHLFSPWEKNHYIEVISPSPLWTGKMIECLKRACVTPETFPTGYADFLKTWRIYEEKGIFMDEEDILKTKPSFFPKKLLLLTLSLSELEKQFFGYMAKKGVEIQYLSLSSQGKSKVSLLEAHNEDEEVSAIIRQVEKLKGEEEKDVAVFCFQIQKYESLFKNTGIEAFSFGPQALVLGKKKYVFVCGLSHDPIPLSLISEEEKHRFNSFFQKTVFKTYSDEKEELKQYLEHCISESENICFTYSRTLALPFQEFFQEYGREKIIQTPPLEHVRRTRRPLSSECGCFRTFSQGDLQKNLLPNIYSARSLEQYQKCPYGFLMKECLGIRAPKKNVLELTPAEEGELLHFILKAYFLKKTSIDNILEESFHVFSKKFEKDILESDKVKVEKIITDFLKEEETRQSTDSFIPRFFELSFGLSENEKPLILKWKGQELKIKGIIDRVDIDERAKQFKVIDYKSGSLVPSTKEVLLGKHFQLVIYAMAVEELILPNYWPSQAYFYLIKDGGKRKKGFEFIEKEEWEDLKERVLGEIFSVKENIEKNLFPMTPQHCYRMCDFKSVCEKHE